MRTAENGWTIEEAGMAQLDDIVGSVMKYVKDNGLDENTIIVFTPIMALKTLPGQMADRLHLPVVKEQH